MAEARRKVLITTESREIVVVRTGEAEIWWHCPKCDTEVRMMTADAVRSSSEPESKIYEPMNEV